MLPPALRLLLVSERGHFAGLLREAFSSDAACDVDIVDASNPVFAAEKLQEEKIDVVGVAHEHDLTLEWIESIRAAAERQPVLVLGQFADREFSALCFEAGASGFLPIDTMTTRELLWQFARAAEYCKLLEENRRLRCHAADSQNEQHQEIQRATAEQDTILNCVGIECDRAPDWLVREAGTLLRNYLSLSLDNFEGELGRLFSLAGDRRIGAAHVIHSLVRSVHQIAEELGPRFSAQVFYRSQVLIMEALARFVFQTGTGEQAHASRPSNAA